MATIGQQLSQPEVGWRRYDDSADLIKYEGTWQSNMPNASSWMGSRHISSNLPDKLVKFVFKGTKFRLLVNSASNRSESSTISIDGENHTFSSRFTTTLTIAPTRLAFEKIDLPYGYHTVIISDTTTDYIDIDAIDIDEDGELVRYDYLDNIDTHELMRKYGVAWFGFDEESGAVLDKLGGNYTGTITGATRVDGWNGKGSSIKASGINQSVNFKTGFNLTNDFTIRLKVKTDKVSNYCYFAGTYQSNNTYRTIMFCLYPNGNLYVGEALSSASYNTVGYFGDLADNKWHDIFFVKTKDNKNILYIDGTLIGKTNGISFSGNQNFLLLNSQNFLTDTTRYLKGSIDDFQIYSKALTPSDFTQKYTAIKTLDNKILTLPNKRGRVKEIPSTEKSDLINESYNWLDIDNAIDRNGIEFAHPTTEYEIAGKNNSILGNGKMFTLPISNFKTVKVENNY